MGNKLYNLMRWMRKHQRTTVMAGLLSVGLVVGGLFYGSWSTSKPVSTGSKIEQRRQEFKIIPNHLKKAKTLNELIAGEDGKISPKESKSFLNKLGIEVPFYEKERLVFDNKYGETAFGGFYARTNIYVEGEITGVPKTFKTWVKELNGKDLDRLINQYQDNQKAKAYRKAKHEAGLDHLW